MLDNRDRLPRWFPCSAHAWQQQQLMGRAAGSGAVAESLCGCQLSTNTCIRAVVERGWRMVGIPALSLHHNISGYYQYTE